MSQKKKSKVGILSLFLSLSLSALIIILITIWLAVIYFRREGYTDEEVFEIIPFIIFDMVIVVVVFYLVHYFWRYYWIVRQLNTINGPLKRIINSDFNERINTADLSDGYLDIAEGINRIAAELADVDVYKADFMSNVSHEIRTPLAVINNYSELLKGDVTEDEKKEYVQVIENASKRLTGMIINVFKLNNLEARHINPKPVVFDLGSSVSECLLGFENVWESKNIDIQADIQDDVMINSDPEILSLIWNNLFSNAFKFTPEGGVVKINVSQEKKFVYVSVEDSGCGINPETGAKIFDKFFQQDLSHASAGNGLGLALVKRVIDMIGGEIKVQSNVGKGSKFTVKLSKGIE